MKVKLTLNQIVPVGQMVEFNGEIYFQNIKIPFYGNLNAKSEQVEILPKLKNNIGGLEPGGFFLGLEGLQTLGWKSPRLDHPGGTLQIDRECNQKASEAPVIRSVW